MRERLTYGFMSLGLLLVGQLTHPAKKTPAPPVARPIVQPRVTPDPSWYGSGPGYTGKERRSGWKRWKRRRGY